jgi:hypothetical protein
MPDKIAKVIDYPDLRKIDDSYIVNTNRTQYEAAKARRKNSERMLHIEEKVANMEQKLDSIVELLQRLAK